MRARRTAVAIAIAGLTIAGVALGFGTDWFVLGLPFPLYAGLAPLLAFGWRGAPKRRLAVLLVFGLAFYFWFWQLFRLQDDLLPIPGPPGTTLFSFSSRSLSLSILLAGLLTAGLLCWVTGSFFIVGVAALAALLASGLTYFEAIGIASLQWHLLIGLSLAWWARRPRVHPSRLPPPNTCASCRYDLAGLTIPTCPECGAAVKLPPAPVPPGSVPPAAP